MHFLRQKKISGYRRSSTMRSRISLFHAPALLPSEFITQNVIGRIVLDGPCSSRYKQDASACDDRLFFFCGRADQSACGSFSNKQNRARETQRSVHKKNIWMDKAWWRKEAAATCASEICAPHTITKYIAEHGDIRSCRPDRSVRHLERSQGSPQQNDRERERSTGYCVGRSTLTTGSRSSTRYPSKTFAIIGPAHVSVIFTR